MTDAEKLEICERRCKFWQAATIRAACGDFTVEQCALALAVQVWSGPNQDDVEHELARAAELLRQRGMPVEWTQ